MDFFHQKLTQFQATGDKIRMKLDNHVVRGLRVAKVFPENTGRISAINFSSNGQQLISCSEDDQIIIYDCDKGTEERTVHSKKYGVDFVQFAPNQDTVLHSSTKVNDAIRFLSLEMNKYVCYFSGHTQKVISLCASPVDQCFLSSSIDKTLRLWDLRSQICQATMHSTGRPIAAFSPDGLIFAAGINSECIKLYDLRSFDKGPFDTFDLKHDFKCEWSKLKFSKNGKTILINTDGQFIYLLDAYDGVRRSIKTFTGHSNYKKLPIEASYSPNLQFIFAGSDDGRVHVWHSDSGYKVCTLKGEHSAPVQCIQFNPKYMMLASACNQLAFWLPNSEDILQ